MKERKKLRHDNPDIRENQTLIPTNISVAKDTEWLLLTIKEIKNAI